MRFFHSIRWRLQLWHGLLLVTVLAGFGFTAWRLQRATQLQRVDHDLERRIAVIADAIRRGGSTPDRPPRDQPPQDQPPQDRPPRSDRRPPPNRRETSNVVSAQPEVRLSPREENLFEGASGLYYVVWQAGGSELSRSATAPREVPLPERGPEPGSARSRGSLREYCRFINPGECVLVGRDIRDELAAVRRFGWILASAGGTILLLGWTGGWWVSARALRPLAAISATAVKISGGDLTQRIRTADTSSELGDLARVLNDTFARLQANFARQAQFTADASHELRTPVTVVLTQTQSALARERPAEEYRESLAACQRAAQRMRRLTESLLTLARLDAGDAATREPCELDRIAGEATESLRPLAEQENVGLTVEFTPVRCQGNAEQIGQVVTNLVSNAISHTRPGGGVRVTVDGQAGVAVLVVSDTGEGISQEDLPHIFERFYRADQTRSKPAGRTGLGLAIAKAIVEAHGGTIEVASELGNGSTFTVRLPEWQTDD